MPRVRNHACRTTLGGADNPTVGDLLTAVGQISEWLADVAAHVNNFKVEVPGYDALLDKLTVISQNLTTFAGNLEDAIPEAEKTKKIKSP